jgi:hypothetical protein
MAAATIAFLGVLRGQGNADLIWHLALGRHIAAARAIPDVNAFYYTPATTPGTDYSWLAQWLFSRLFGLFGGTGLAVLNALVAGATFYLLHGLLARASRNLLLNVAVLAAAFQLIGPYFGCRPVIFTVLFFALFVRLLSDGRRDVLAAWLLPVVTALWVNLHPGFLLAPLTVALFLAIGRGRTRLLAVCLGLVCVAVALNPRGPRLYLLPADIVRSWHLLRGLTEWNGPSGVLVAVMCALLTVTAWLAGRLGRVRASAAALVIAAVAGIAAYRNLPFFAIVAVWAIGEHLQMPERWPRGLGWLGRFDVSIANVGGWAWAVAVPAALVIHAALAPGAGLLPLDLGGYPVGAVEWLRDRPPAGNVFVREEWSGYLLWEMPDRKLFHDAKGGFSREAAQDHRTLAVPLAGWRHVADKYGIGTFLLRRETGLATVLAEAADWTLIHSDSLAAVYVRVPTDSTGP